MKKELVFRLVLVLVIAFLIFQFGIKPILNNGKSEPDYTQDGGLSSDKDRYDLIVLGEEPEGIAAAAAAARLKARTLLISEGKDLGGVVKRSMKVGLEPVIGSEGEILNKGIFTEFYNRLDMDFSIDRYLRAADTIVKEEKNLDVLYECSLESPVLANNTIIGVNVLIGGEKRTYSGKRFIDATRDGKLLSKCGVPYLTGFQDLNMKSRYLPSRLNFTILDVDSTKLEKLVSPTNTDFYNKIKQYKTDSINTAIEGFKAVDQGNGRVVIQGLEVYNLDLNDSVAVQREYKNARKECINFASFLAAEFPELKDIKFEKAAEEFYNVGKLRFAGEYTLSPNDVLENKDFYDRVSIGNYPIRISVNDNEEYFIGKPTLYSIPLGCLVPLKIDNLLMVGGKASYSSLAASSADNLGTNITGGEAAGLVAVYTIKTDVTPRKLYKTKDINSADELQNFLQKQGLKLPKMEIKNKNADNWSYLAVRKLNTLGLISTGLTNNYLFERPATQQDLVVLILNGIYRLPLGNYTLELDARLRPYMNGDKLTLERAGEILLKLHNEKGKVTNAFDKAYEKGYIDNIGKLHLQDKKVLRIEDVYYLAARNIEKYTGQEISE